MSGPEHYREAERLITPTTDPASGVIPITVLPSPQMIAVAQVHATLALAAATADPWAEQGWKQALS